MPLIGQIPNICYILQVWSNYSMALIGQLIKICMCFTSAGQLSDAIDRSDR